MKKLDLQAIREDFQQSDIKIYFNSGLVGFPAKSVFQKTTEFYQQLHFKSESEYFQIFGEMEALWQETAPQFINCSPEEIIGLPNTTTGMNYITTAIPWRPGDNVVISELEFVSQHIAFHHFKENFGFEIRVAKRDGWRIPLENVTSLIDERTRLVALSYVSFVNGFRHNIAAIAEAAHQKGAWVAIDAIQALGPLKVDVKALDVDFLVSGNSKWLMSLPGWGVMYVRKEIISQLRRPVAGFLSLENQQEAIDDWSDGPVFVKPYEITNSRIDKFRLSTENIMGKLSLLYSMKNFMRLGQETIERHVLELSGYLMERLQEKGHELRSVQALQHRSAIVSFLPRREPENFLQKMERRNIYFCRRGGGYRISLHVFNTFEEIDRCIDAIEQIISSRT